MEESVKVIRLWPFLSKLIWVFAVVMFVFLMYVHYGPKQHNLALSEVGSPGYAINSANFDDELLNSIYKSAKFVDEQFPLYHSTYQSISLEYLHKIESSIQQHLDWQMGITNTRLIFWSDYWELYFSIPHDFSTIPFNILSNTYIDWTSELRQDNVVYKIPHYKSFWESDQIIWKIFIVFGSFILLWVFSFVVIFLFIYWPLRWTIRFINWHRYDRFEKHKDCVWLNVKVSFKAIRGLPAGLLVMGMEDHSYDYYYNCSEKK